MRRLIYAILCIILFLSYVNEIQAMGEPRRKTSPEGKTRGASGAVRPAARGTLTRLKREPPAGLTKAQGKVIFVGKDELVIQDSKNEEFIHTLKLDRSTQISTEDGVVVEASEIKVGDILQASYVEEFAEKTAREIILLSE
jgi:hypothetical protein